MCKDLSLRSAEEMGMGFDISHVDVCISCLLLWLLTVEALFAMLRI